MTASLTDLLNFDVSLIDNQGKLIEFALNQKKAPSLSFTIEVLKW